MTAGRRIQGTQGSPESPEPPGSKHASWIGAALIASFVVIAGATLGDYGITWDEGLGDLYFGDLYLEFFASGCDASRLRPPDHWLEPGQPDIARSPFRGLPVHHWPVGNVIVAACGAIFDRSLHLLGPIEARHLGIVLLAALALAATWTFAREVFGVQVATTAVLILGSYPEFFSISHNIVKDVGECAFYGWTIVAFYRAVTRRSPWWLAGAAVSFGLALGTKLNAAFAIVTLLLWFGLPTLVRIRQWWPRPPLWPALSLIGVFLAGFAIFVASWPWLWVGPAGNIVNPLGNVVTHLEVFRNAARGGPESWQFFPIAEAFVRTPPVVLACVAAGAVALVMRWRAPPLPAVSGRLRGSGVWLLVLWLLVPLVRCMLPGYRNYDGIRRFLEFLPPFAILAGVGVAAVGDAIAGRLPRNVRLAVPGALTILAVAGSVWIDVHLHPHQATYLNRWRGERVPLDYSGNSLREAIDWLNVHAEPGSSVMVPVALWLVEIGAPAWLRKDLRVMTPQIANASDPSPPVAGSRPSEARGPRYVVLLNRPEFSRDAEAVLRVQSREAHRIEIDGHPILSIFRFPE